MVNSSSLLAAHQRRLARHLVELDRLVLDHVVCVADADWVPLFRLVDVEVGHANAALSQLHGEQPVEEVALRNVLLIREPAPSSAAHPADTEKCYLSC